VVGATVIWRPEAMTARLIAAVAPAALDLQRVAQARCASKSVAPTIRAVPTGSSATLGTAHPLGKIIEGGAHPHEITPKKGELGVLKLADGSFVRGSVKHPGSPAKPFLKPTLALWPTAYRRHASAAMRGFV
jgi:hypothetical protein